MNKKSYSNCGLLIISLIAGSSYALLAAHIYSDLVSIAQTQGMRPTMEDAHAIETHCSTHRREPKRWIYHCFGLYDGHGGRAIADYAAQHMFSTFIAYINDNDPDHYFSLIGFMDCALDYSFCKVHDDACKLLGKKADNQGCTALAAVIHNGMLFVANAGDSRAVIYNGQHGACAMSEDHKPNRPSEKSRIEALGGCVIMHGVPRVQGVLAVSRALGDKKLHPFVTPVPELMRRFLLPEDRFLILACDGVWDVLSNEEAVDVVQSELNRSGNEHKAAEALKDEALKRGSTDNISVMIVLNPYMLSRT